MFQETLLLIWSQLLLMMYALETTRKCFTRNFCLTEKKMPLTTLPGVTTLLEKKFWIRLTIAYESLLTIRKMSKGFGFIQPKGAGEKQVFAHWKEIHTDEQWPVLQKGAEVEFILNESDDKGKRSAEKITEKGGGKITNQEDDRDFDEENIYTGTVNFFDGYKGFGFITPDE